MYIYIYIYIYIYLLFTVKRIYRHIDHSQNPGRNCES